MIFDDHDVHDDWNTSEAWVEEMRAQPWWQRRITGALATYWIYQHIGNLAPEQLERDELLARVRAAGDAGDVLHKWATTAEREGGGGIWSFSRDLGRTRLVVLDGREGRVLSHGRRKMFDDEEWEWLERQVTGDFDHLLLANTLPVLLAPTFHHLEAWSDAVCAGAWGDVAARLGERLRQGIDLEHWAAFRESFERLIGLVREVGAGRRGSPPASIVLLGGDVHQAYLYEVAFRRGADVESAVYQAVCSPIHNLLPESFRRTQKLANSRAGALISTTMARLAGVPRPRIGWRITRGPWFRNMHCALEFSGRTARIRFAAASGGAGQETPGTAPETPRLETLCETELSG
jgi:hypothetical protein